MSAEQIDLLPCPFCGGEAKIRISWLSRSKVECIDCGASTVWLGQIADCPTPPWIRISSAWNRRASPVNTALAEDAARAHDLALEVERLKADLRFAEAALADIGDAEREEGDDLAWCERRAAKTLPRIRATIRDTHAATAAIASARDSIPESE